MTAICPNCGKTAIFKHHEDELFDENGQLFYDVWFACQACHAFCTQEELDKENEEKNESTVSKPEAN